MIPKRKLSPKERMVLRLRRGIHRRRYFKDVRNNGDPHYAELIIRLEGKSLNPPTDAKIQTKLMAKLEFRRNLRIQARNEKFATHWMKRAEEGQEGTEMAGLFAMERTLTFLSFFTAPRTKLKLQDIHLLLLCGGNDGIPMRVASDMTGLNYHTIRASMRKMIRLGYVTQDRPGKLKGGSEEKFRNGPHLELTFPFTQKGDRLRADLAKFDTSEFSHLFDLMQGLDPIKNVTKPREKLHSAIRCSLEEMQSKLTLDW